jgi:hypothetical protein
MENFGLINKPIDPQRWIYKTYSPLLGGELNSTADWEQYLPVVEFQNLFGFDTMACVTYSFLNCIETLWKFQGNTERNFSDRFLATMSGTTRAGNTFDGVADGARRCGLVNESEYPHNADSWNEYYQVISDEILAIGRKFLKDYEIKVEYVRTYRLDDILEALKSSPLQVTVKYASGEGNLNPTGDWNHAVTCYGYKMNEYWKIYDHYSQTKKKYAWNYEFGAINKFTLQKIKPTFMTVQDNVLYQLVEGLGGFALGLDGRLIIDDVAKILASWEVRNNGDTKGMTKAVRQADWDSVPHINLKGESI